MTGPTPRTPAHPPVRPPAPPGSTPAAPTGAEAPAPATAGPATSTAPGAAARWRRARGLLLALVVLLATGVTLAALGQGTHHGRLDPRSADPTGSRAVAELLKERGVTTRVVTTAREAAEATGPGTTLLITSPDRLGDTQLSLLRSAMDLSGGRTVLLAPSATGLPGLAPGVHTKGTASHHTLAPGCALPAATSAGRAGTGGDHRYTTDLPGATSCYPSNGHPTLLVLPTGTGTGGATGDTVLLGSETILLNETLAEEGNASLALQLLGSRPGLVWYLPSLTDADSDGAGQEQDLFGLIPPGWSWALLQLFLAAALAALWRARRLGPLVTEKLPVAVRASEATEGRARLYHRAGARDHAAAVLRAATRERLAALVGVPPSQAHQPPALLPAVSARLAHPATAAPAPRDTATLLFGPTPADDAALVALADHLDALEREVRTS
ncbi:DUF4350 domain-containing protein [Streptomyces sp. NPDC051567]|uniref:DUF4350 domain-containing protein n=1 Tax=Streptomyces sp. NPDC051567 TaxID=3365660 RepID=UPI0037B4D30C